MGIVIVIIVIMAVMAVGVSGIIGTVIVRAVIVVRMVVPKNVIINMDFMNQKMFTIKNNYVFDAVTAVS